MHVNRWMGALSVLLALGIAASAILGPLWLNVIRQHISANVESQVIGADAVSLAFVAPLALVAGLLWWRGHRLAPVIALGPAVYSVYIFFQYIAGSEFLLYDGNSEKFFPLFYGVVLLGLVVAVAGWSAIDTASLPMPDVRVRVSVAAVLLTLGVFLGLAWIRWIYDVAQGARPNELIEHPALSWLVKTMDLSFVIPASIATGVGLLMRRQVAVKMAYGLVTAFALLAASVGSMALVMTFRDDPSTEPIFVGVMFAGAAGLTVLNVNLWRSFMRHEAPAVQESARTPVIRQVMRRPTS
jgi:hypothetical protein